MTVHTPTYCTNVVKEILIEGMMETIGPVVNSLNKFTLSPRKEGQPGFMKVNEVCCFLNQVTAFFGELGSKGIAHRVGEASFRYFLKKYGRDYHLAENSFRLMNSQNRIPYGLQQLAEFVKQNCDVEIDVEEDEKNWYWVVQINGKPKEDLDLYQIFTRGLIREYLSFASGGRYYPIRISTEIKESNTISRVAIARQPLDH